MTISGKIKRPGIPDDLTKLIINDYKKWLNKYENMAWLTRLK
jgi:hypothetical protein